MNVFFGRVNGDRRLATMLSLTLGLATALSATLVSAALAQSPPNASGSTNDTATAAGFWQAPDNDDRPTAWFFFVDNNSVFEGHVVKSFKIPGQPVFDTCAHCPPPQKDAPMLGLTIVKDMKRDGTEYKGGSILDPRDGSVYHAQMQISPDGKKLFVRGYLGVPLLGQTQTWTRVPDEVVAAANIPKELISPKGLLVSKPISKPIPSHKPAAKPAPIPEQQ